MAKSIDLAVDPSRPASLLRSYTLQYAPSSRLAGRAPRATIIDCTALESFICEAP
jgi:hypothetical protein